MIKKCFPIVGVFLLFLLFSSSIKECSSESTESKSDTFKRTYRAISEKECQVPKIENGTIIVIGTNSSTNKPIKNGATVSIKCDLNLELNTKYSNITCRGGEWSKDVPKCIHTCPGYSNPFIELTCELNDIVRNCSEPALEGTIMQMACIPHYVHNATDPKAVCQNGEWNRPVLICHPDCGKRIAKGETYIVHGETAKEGEFPWHTGVYKTAKENEDNEIPIYQCGGSIITTKSVMSAAHCFTNSIDGKLLPNKYYIGAGKIKSPYNATEDGEQLRKVKQVIVPDQYRGAETTYQRDIAILILEDLLIITQKIQPICVDWDTKYETQSLVDGNIGELVGWGISNEAVFKQSIPLKLLKVPFINESYCTKHAPEDFKKYIPDKICAGFNKMEKSACKGDSGGGLVFPIDKAGIKTYYIRGIVSAGPQSKTNVSSCDADHYTIYTKISTHLPFIKQSHIANNITTGVNTTIFLTGGCGAPEIKHGRLILSEFTYMPRVIVPNKSTVTVVCEDGYSVFPPTSVILTCSSGEWDRPSPHCYLCGQRYNQTQQLKDSVKNIPELPWHVSIYRSLNNTRYFFGCGGSIISPNIVISVRNCFPDVDSKKGVTDEFEVVAAKWRSEDFGEDKVVEEFEQSRCGTTSDVRYFDELALVILKEPFELTPQVQPVCVDWDSQPEIEQLNERKIGSVASWSAIKYGHKKEQTLADYQFERIDRCTAGVSPDRITKLITGNFCVRHINDTVILCQPNEGSGISFLNETDNRYFLRGVAINGYGSRLYCSGKEYNVFLRLSEKFKRIIRVFEDIFGKK